MYRDAVRIGQIAGASVPGPQQQVVLEEALTLSDRAAMIWLCDASLRGSRTVRWQVWQKQARSALVGEMLNPPAGPLPTEKGSTRGGAAQVTKGVLRGRKPVMEEKGP